MKCTYLLISCANWIRKHDQEDSQSIIRFATLLFDGTFLISVDIHRNVDGWYRYGWQEVESFLFPNNIHSSYNIKSLVWTNFLFSECKWQSYFRILLLKTRERNVNHFDLLWRALFTQLLHFINIHQIIICLSSFICQL